MQKERENRIYTRERQKPKRCKWFGEDDEKESSRYGRLIINKRSQGEQSARDGGDWIEKTQAIDNVEPIMWQTLSVESVLALCMQCSFSISPDALCLSLAEVFSTVLKNCCCYWWLDFWVLYHINEFPIWRWYHSLISVLHDLCQWCPSYSDSEH